MELSELIKNKIKSKEVEIFKDLNLKVLDLKTFSNVLNKTLHDMGLTSSLNNELLNIESFIDFYYEENKDKKNNINDIIFESLTEFLEDYKKISDKINFKDSIIILKILTKYLNKDKLNQYNNLKNTSILNLLLTNENNINFIPLFIEIGLEFKNSRNLDPYFYIMENQTYNSVCNSLAQELYKNNIPLPEKHWEYVFNANINYKNLKGDYLLNLEPKNFIVNEIENFSVWNQIIKKEKYELIKYLSKDMYKTHTVNGKSLLDEMIENKNLKLCLQLGDNIYKLLENKRDIEKLWDSVEFSSLCEAYTLSMFNILNKKDKDCKKTDLINSKVLEIENIVSNFLCKPILDSIYNDMYLNNKKDKKEMDYSDFNSLMELKNLDTYYPNLNIITKQDITSFLDTFNNKYREDSKDIYNLKLLILRHYKKLKLKSSLGNLEEHFSSYINAFDMDKLDKLKDSLLEYLDSFIYLNEKLEEKKELVLKKEKSELNEGEILLFTDKSILTYISDNKSNESQIIQTYISTLKKNDKNNQIKTLAKSSVLLEKIDVLYKTFPHFEKVIEHIESLMILQNNGDKSFYIPPLLLGGGAGVGKTFFCDTICKLVDTHFELLNMESMTANFILTGSNSQWSGAEPGKIFKSLFNKENKTMNPIFLLDELDKAGGDSRFSVMNSLLPLLERYTAKNFKDECIDLQIDASYINWFATANDLDKISIPLKSRFEIFSIPNPTYHQRKSLIKAIYQKVRENNTWGSFFNDELPNETLDCLASIMSPGAARDLRKSITKACSKAIRDNSKELLPIHIEKYDMGEQMPWNVTI